MKRSFCAKQFVVSDVSCTDPFGNEVMNGDLYSDGVCSSGMKHSCDRVDFVTGNKYSSVINTLIINTSCTSLQSRWMKMMPLNPLLPETHFPSNFEI